MVQIMAPPQDKAPIFNMKLKTIYLIILITGIVVVYELTMGKDVADDRLIFSNFDSERAEHVRQFQEEQHRLEMQMKGLSTSSAYMSMSTTVEFVSSNAIQQTEAQQNVVQQPQQNVVQQPQQNVVQQPQQNVVQEPQQNVVQEPQQNVVQQPQPNVVQEPQQNVVQQPQPNVVQEPQQNVVQLPQQNIVQQPQQDNVQQPQQNIEQNVVQQHEQNVDSQKDLVDQWEQKANLQHQDSQPTQRTCPAVDRGGIHDRILNLCGGLDRFKNNWVELTNMYDIPPTHLLYDVDRNYVWVTVPKIASSNMKRVIIHDKFGYEVGSPQMKKALESPHITLKGCCVLTRNRAKMYHSLQKAYTFTFTRNPFTRIYSAYHDKIQMYSSFDDYYYIKKVLFIVRSWSWDQVEDTPAVIKASKTITFLEFLIMLSKTDTGTYNDHWKPWFLITDPCLIKYDFIGYLENIGEDFEKVKSTIFGDLDFHLEDKYRSNYSKNIIEEYKKIPTEVLSKIIDRFQDDFTIGGYSTDFHCL